MCRLTRLTNGFSDKWEKLWAAYCLHFAYCNFPGFTRRFASLWQWKRGLPIGCGRLRTFGIGICIETSAPLAAWPRKCPIQVAIQEPSKPPRPAGSSFMGKAQVSMDEDGSIKRLSRTKQEMETDLLEELRLRQREWNRASEEDRDVARQRFMNALDTFYSLVLHGLVLHGKPPK